MTPELLAAEAELPGWVVYGPLWYALGAAGFTLAVGLVFTTLAARKVPPPGAAPWYERARHAQGVRAILTGLAGLPLVFGILGLGFTGPLGWPGSPLRVVLPAVLSLCALSLVRVYANRKIFPDRGAWRLWRERAVIVALVYPGLVVALAAAAVMPAELTAASALWVAPLTVALLLLGSGAAVRGWMALGLLRPAPPRVLAAVARATESTGIRPRHVCALDLDLANAFAFPAVSAVVVTRAAEEALDDAELEAIAAHELGHLAEGPSVLVVRLGLAPALMCLVAFLRPLFHGLGAFGVLGVALAGLVAARLAVRLFRKMESRADAHSHHDGAALARALEKVYERNLLPAVTGAKRQVHPDLFDRMVAAGAPPSWPKPAPPPNARASRVVGVGFMAAAVFVFVQLRALASDGEDVFTQELAVALSAGDAADLTSLGVAFREEGDWRRAEVFLRAAGHAGWRARALLADVLARGGKCESAAATQAEALSAWRGQAARARPALFEMVEAAVQRCQPAAANPPAP